MALRQRIQDYFKLTDEQKSEILIEIIKIYQKENYLRYQNTMKIKDLIDIDIEVYEEEEEFELVQALTDIKNAIIETEKEFKDGLK